VKERKGKGEKEGREGLEGDGEVSALLFKFLDAPLSVCVVSRSGVPGVPR